MRPQRHVTFVTDTPSATKVVRRKVIRTPETVVKTKASRKAGIPKEVSTSPPPSREQLGLPALGGSGTTLAGRESFVLTFVCPMDS